MAFPLFAPRGVSNSPALERRPSAEVASADPARARVPFAREAGALVLLATALYVALALASFQADPMRPEVAGSDWVGPVGSTAAQALVTAIGVIAWYAPLELALLAAPLL